MVAGPFEMLRQMHVDEPRLDDRIAVAKIHLEDLLHPRERNHHAAPDGQTAAGQAGAGPAGHEGDIELVARFDNRDDLLPRLGKQHDVRSLFLYDVAIALIDKQLFGSREHAAVPYDFEKSREQLPSHCAGGRSGGWRPRIRRMGKGRSHG